MSRPGRQAPVGGTRWAAEQFQRGLKLLPTGDKGRAADTAISGGESWNCS